MRKLLRIVLLAAALAGLLAGAGYFYLKQSLPVLEGTIRIAGLDAPVELLRDAYGIPHIRAQSIEDAYFGLGFAHAQDRLWQMEIDRRIAAGRLAEILGAKALDTDRFLRTLGVRRAADASLTHLDAGTRRLLDAYAAGVNAFLATRPVLPPEFWLLRTRPEPWTATDSIAWIKMMAWDLGANWKNELLRMRLAKTLSNARIEELLPPYPGDAPPKIADLKELYAGLGGGAQGLAKAMQQVAARLPHWLGAGAGSNNWVVSGKRSASGKPLLANDPHLDLSAPPVWYFAQLSAPGLDAIGATLPGVPGVLLGRNSRIAWGATNTGPDVQDLYIEKLQGRDAYLTPGGPRPFTLREETIRVRGGPDFKLTVRSTRHGPVISDVLRQAKGLAPQGYVLAFDWTALSPDDTSIRAAMNLGRAQNWKEFRDALRDLQAPQQNMVYADVDGNIGFVAAGRVPVRKADNDLKGLAPAPGWEAKYDWAGWIPFDELPQSYNPPGGEIVTANQKIVPPGYRPFITSEWQPPYRAERIKQLLDAVPRHTVPSFARMQADVVSLPAREQLPRMLKTRPASAQARQALELLSGLGRQHGGRPTRAADHDRVVARARARDLRRRAGRRVRGLLEAAAGVHRQRARRQGRAVALVRRREHAQARDLRRNPFGLARGGARRPAQALRQGHAELEMGRGASRAAPAPSVRAGRVARALLRHQRAEPGRGVHRQRRAQPLQRRRASLRQPPRREPARDLRSVQAGGVALHPFGRAVGQPALARLPRLHPRLGGRRVHPDAEQPRAHRGRTRHAPAHAGAATLRRRRR